MALKAAAHMLIVSLSGDTREPAQGRLIVTRQEGGNSPIVYRGVVISIGSHVQEDVEVGNVAHYLQFVELDGVHLVSVNGLLAYEDELS